MTYDAVDPRRTSVERKVETIALTKKDKQYQETIQIAARGLRRGDLPPEEVRRICAALLNMHKFWLNYHLTAH